MHKKPRDEARGFGTIPKRHYSAAGVCGATGAAGA